MTEPRDHGDALERDRKFIRIPIENILPGKPTPFSLYHEVEGEHILFRGARRVIEKQERDRLLQTHCTGLFIAAADHEKYRAYLDEGLRALLVTRDLPLDQKVRAFYSMSNEIGQGVLSAPDRPESLAGASEIVRESFAFLSNGKGILHRLMEIMAGEYDLVTHSVNVTNYGLALARMAGIRENRAILEIGLGLFLHDAGLRLLPERVQRRKGPLTSEDRSILRNHPLFGLDLLSAGNLLPERSLVIIRDHHERLDGTGYPGGLSGDRLSVEARIAQIVVAFDSLTTARPSRRAVSSYEAIRSMVRDTPKAFDGDLLGRFIALIGKEKGPVPRVLAKA